MKINQIIREKRKELSLTQEQIADFFADTYEAVIRQFCFPEWVCYNAHLQLALVKKD